MKINSLRSYFTHRANFSGARFVLASVLLVNLISCTGQPPAPATEEATLEAVQFVPTTPLDDSSPLPTPTPTLGPGPTITVPAPEADTGVVHGRLLHLDERPFVETTLRLGTIVWTPGKEGEDGYVASDRTAAPQVVTDPWGNFVFESIAPGSYGLAVDNPEFPDATVFVLSDAGDKIMVVNVEAGGVVNLNEVQLEFE